MNAPGTRRTRFDTNQTVIDAADQDDFQRALEDEELFLGTNDAIDDSEEKTSGLLDDAGVALVSMMQEDAIVDIYPATIFEFTDYLKRGKITALRKGFEYKY